jgi:hypothetical protein
LSRIQGPNVPATRSATLGGQPAYFLTYFASNEVKTYRIFTVKDRKAYVLTLTSSAQLNEAREIPILYRLIENFSFLKSGESVNEQLYSYENVKWRVGLDFSPDFQFVEENVGVTGMFVDKEAPNPFSYQTNVNFLINDMSSQPMDTDSFANVIWQDIEKQSEDVKLKKKEKTILAGVPAWQVIYETKLSNELQTFELRCLQTSMVFENHSYLLSYGALVDKFDSKFEQAKQMMGSFRFLKTANEFPVA